MASGLGGTRGTRALPVPSFESSIFPQTVKACSDTKPLCRWQEEQAPLPPLLVFRWMLAEKYGHPFAFADMLPISRDYHVAIRARGGGQVARSLPGTEFHFCIFEIA